MNTSYGICLASALFSFQDQRVIKGKQQARQFGMPTANVKVDGHSISSGTYAGFARVGDNKHFFKALFYVPSKRENRPDLIETHLFNFNDITLYGQKISGIIFVKVSDTVEFTTIEDLQKKIDQDRALCLEALRKMNIPRPVTNP